jgi:hypothetical protein
MYKILPKNVLEFTEIVKKTFLIFGELDLEIKKVEGGHKLIYLDKHIVHLDEEIDGIPNRELDVTTSVLNLKLNKEGIIQIIDHNYLILTPANKKEVAFCSAIIGDKINM